MELINNLLVRYTKLFKDKQVETSLIIEEIKKQTSLNLKNNDIKLKEGILFVQTKPKYKLEIILKKNEILRSLNDSGIKIIDLK